MKEPAPIREHPNATYVFVTAPLSALLGWLLSLRWHLPAEATASIGSTLSSALLVVSHAVKAAAGSVWNAVWNLGIAGCCRRIWKGAGD